jgi:hypothetical protein
MIEQEGVKMLSIDVIKTRLDIMGVKTTGNMSRRKHELLYQEALTNPNKKQILYDKLQTAQKDKYYLTNKRKRSGI